MPFIELFQLEEECSREANVQSSLEDGLKILEEVADLMKDIERKAYFRTRRRCPQGPDLAFTKPTRDAFNMLRSSFERTKSFLSENNLQHIAEDIFFPSFATLHVEHFFAGMRTPSRPPPDMYDYAIRRPSCIIESVQKVSVVKGGDRAGNQSDCRKKSRDRLSTNQIAEHLICIFKMAR